MTPTEYEQAVLEHIRILFPGPYFRVRHNVRLRGSKSRVRRQLDIAVFESNSETPAFVVEAKRYKRPVNVTTAGSIVALVQDIGGTRTIVASATGFSVAARNHLGSEGIDYIQITLDHAKALQWVPFFEEKFAIDREFKKASGFLMEALRTGDPEPFLGADIPYEEWLAVMACGEEHFPNNTWDMLKRLARDHVDDGVRFNSILILMDANALSPSETAELVRSEPDPPSCNYSGED